MGRKIDVYVVWYWSSLLQCWVDRLVTDNESEAKEKLAALDKHFVRVALTTVRVSSPDEETQTNT